jgi:hypothetical protein
MSMVMLRDPIVLSVIVMTSGGQAWWRGVALQSSAGRPAVGIWVRVARPARRSASSAR